jgi:hypothetical protein
MFEDGTEHFYIGYGGRLVRDLFDGRLSNSSAPVKKKRLPKPKFLPVDRATIRPRRTMRPCGVVR